MRQINETDRNKWPNKRPMCDRLCPAAQRWLAHAAKASTEAPPTGGAVVLAGNVSAHELVVQCHLRSLRLEYLEDIEAWRRLSCVRGCPSLVDEVAQALDERDGRWSVLFVEGAQHAPAKQLNQLVSRFWQQSRCEYPTVRKRVDVDCRRVLFALSTSWGAQQVAHPDARSWSVGRLQSAALVEAAPFLSSEEMSLRARQRLRGAVAVVLGEEGPDFFSSLMAQQDEERRLRRGAREEQTTSASLPSLSVFDRVVGQQAVVQELRQRLLGIANGADGGEDAHTFFFYGFPGTGKTYVAELLALAQHGRRSPPYYQRFSMQNYKTDEDLWKLVSPPCGVKGEGAFAALFANGSGCGNGGCGGRGPVVLFDEIEEARSDFMTSALVNAIDHRGFVEFYRKYSDGTCESEQAPTAGAFIVLTSNCFMDDLDEVWTAARQSNRSVAEVYEATRREMDRRIFDDGIPCSHDGRASPFAARKMRDRMRGNVYPFLPLSEVETVRAFELQLQQRADLYWETSSVEMYWTSHYVNFYARHSPHGVAELHNATFTPRTIATSRSKHRISLRKQMESMMRLDVNSVERLYARGNEQCSLRGAGLRSLVLHVRGGEASGTSFCSSSQLVSDQVIDALADSPELNTTIEANRKPRWFAQVASAEQCAAGSRLAFGEIPSFTSWIPRGDISSMPLASGFMVLGGNASAHEDALMCVLGHLAESILWSKLSCAAGCPSLVNEVAQALDERDGRWSVLFVEGAQHAPAKQLNQLVSRFWQQSRCVYATARKRVDVDCRRVLFALSTSWGAQQVAHPDARSWSVGRLQSAALVEAAPFLSSEEMSLRARQRLRGAVAVVLGEEGPDFFSSLMAQQDEERRLRRGAREEQTTSASLPSLSVFDRVVGQQAVVQELRQRLLGIANGADGGEDAHTFFFYGFPGTGKTYVAELLALAQHGRRSPPYYQRFSMQNYKTDEDLWKLVSPPCGVKGEGAFAALFANGSGCGNGGCGGRGPVVLFDEIEEARSDFMTSALVNAIDHRGFVEFYRKYSDGTCESEQAPTAGAFIVLTSNCFMDDLDEVWTAARQSNRSVAEVYEATRREMDRRIFDDGIPCSHDGRASPFAARKMRDRMRGNVYPFLPLSEVETIRAFELQLQQRADLYWETSSVEMYWTSEFARLVVHKGTPAMQVDVSAVGLYRRADFLQGSLSSQARPRSSLRKQMESMMRLDVNSVERLYARGNEQCSARGERMRSLVLHVRGGEACAISFCDGAILSGTSASEERFEQRSAVAHATVNGGSPKHTDDRGRAARAAGQKSASPEKEIIVTTDMQHVKETGLLKEQNMQLALKIELLEGRILELQADLLRWKLLCLVLATLFALTFAGLTYLLLGYTAALVKVGLVAVSVVATTCLVLSIACMLGSRPACWIQDILLHFAKMVTWLFAQLAYGLWLMAKNASWVQLLLFLAITICSFFAIWRARARRQKSPTCDAATDPLPSAEFQHRSAAATPETTADLATLVVAMQKHICMHNWADEEHLQIFQSHLNEMSVLLSPEAPEYSTSFLNASSMKPSYNLLSVSLSRNTSDSTLVGQALPADHAAGVHESTHPSRPAAEAVDLETAFNEEVSAEVGAPKPTRSFAKKHKNLYSSVRDCERYDSMLCRCQDHAGNVRAAIKKEIALTSATHVVDVGCGTGKLARLVAPFAHRVSAFDRSAEAIQVAEAFGATNITYCVADLRQIPLNDDSAQAVLAGWALSYLKAEHEIWYPDGSSGGDWKHQVNRALAEIERILSPGGVAMIFETFGTATERPLRSGSWLYAHFRSCGLKERCIRTDYLFENQANAISTLRFFFGRGVASRASEIMNVDSTGRCFVPECTGMWVFYKGELQLKTGES